MTCANASSAACTAASGIQGILGGVVVALAIPLYSDTQSRRRHGEAVDWRGKCTACPSGRVGSLDSPTEQTTETRSTGAARPTCAGGLARFLTSHPQRRVHEVKKQPGRGRESKSKEGRREEDESRSKDEREGQEKKENEEKAKEERQRGMNARAAEWTRTK